MYLWMCWWMSFSVNLCKRALDVTADVIVKATRNADMLTINTSEDFQQNAQSNMNDYKTHNDRKQSDQCHNCTFYNINAECHVNDTCRVIHRFTNIVASVLPCVTKHWSIRFCKTIYCKWQCDFMIKNLSYNFGCMLLEHSLIKSVILLTYILYYLKKYTSRVCAYFVVLGTCSSLYPDQEPQSTSEFIDKCGFKTDRKRSSGVLSSSSQSHFHLRRHLKGICIYS